MNDKEILRVAMPLVRLLANTGLSSTDRIEIADSISGLLRQAKTQSEADLARGVVSSLQGVGRQLEVTQK